MTAPDYSPQKPSSFSLKSILLISICVIVAVTALILPLVLRQSAEESSVRNYYFFTQIEASKVVLSLVSNKNFDIDIQIQTLHPKEAFNKAMAEVWQKRHVPQPLVAISPWNSKLIWNDTKTMDLVLMVTAVSPRHLTFWQQGSNGQPLSTRWDTWLTAAPQLKDFLTEYSTRKGSQSKEDILQDRMHQYLGLQYSDDLSRRSRAIVELWVRPQDLFRPCFDAEIFDSECVLDLHDLKDQPASFQEIFKSIRVDPDHMAWMQKTRSSHDSAYPWSRLGYTYDWSPEADTHVGASEFILKNGSKVFVRRTYDYITEYLKS